MKNAIILAAGKGSRLLQSTDVANKALIPIGGRPLIEQQIEILRSARVESVSVVIGHAGERVQSLLGDSVSYIHNTKYAETNSLYSLWLAMMHCAEPFVLLNCDLLFHPQILKRLLETDGSALAYDSGSGLESEQMKISLENGYLTAMAKDIPKENIRGENIGLLKFDRQAIPLLYREAARLVKAGQHNQWAPAAVSALSQWVPIRAVDISGLPWIEIDFAWDLKSAKNEICPSIPGCALMPGPQDHAVGRYANDRWAVGNA